MWRRADDRFGRSADRFASICSALAGATRDGASLDADLAALVADVDAARDGVRALCLTGQQAAPSSGLDLPGGSGGRWLDVHRDLSRAATACAQACEAATMLRVELGRDAPADGARPLPVAAVRRAVDAVGEAVARAQARASA